MKKMLLIIFLALLLVPHSVLAQTKVGSATAKFLSLGTSARAVAMGDAFIAVADDPSATFYNPAGLTAVSGRQVMLNHTSLWANINQEFGVVVFDLDLLKIGLSMSMLTMDDMEITTPLHPDGTGEYFTCSEYFGGLSMAADLTDKFSAGFTAKYLNSYLFNEEISAKGWAVDIGTLYRSGFHSLRFGMAITNFGPDIKYIEESHPLPINFRAGVAMEVIENANHMLTVAFEGSHPNDNEERANVGLEYWFSNFLALRGGYRFEYDDAKWSVGGGLNVRDGMIQVDYALDHFEYLSDVHRITAILAF